MTLVSIAAPIVPVVDDMPDLTRAHLDAAVAVARELLPAVEAPIADMSPAHAEVVRKHVRIARVRLIEIGPRIAFAAATALTLGLIEESEYRKLIELSWRCAGHRRQFPEPEPPFEGPVVEDVVEEVGPGPE